MAATPRANYDLQTKQASVIDIIFSVGIDLQMDTSGRFAHRSSLELAAQVCSDHLVIAEVLVPERCDDRPYLSRLHLLALM
jgi:hypothetical protein